MTQDMTEPHNDPDRKKILNLYALLGVSLILMALPYALAAVVSLFFLLLVLSMAYFARSQGEEGSLRQNHAIYIIKTIWLSGFYAMFTTGAAAFYMLPRMDNAPLESCSQALVAQAQQLAESESIAALSALLQPCMHPFVTANWNVLVPSLLIAAGPIVLFLLFRFTRGLSRAIKGYRISKPHSWV